MSLKGEPSTYKYRMAKRSTELLIDSGIILYINKWNAGRIMISLKSNLIIYILTRA